MARKRRAFVVPLGAASDARMNQIKREARSGFLGVSKREVVASPGVRRSRRGLLIDFSKSFNSQGSALRTLRAYLNLGFGSESAKANVERIKLMQQLRKLGNQVFVPHYGSGSPVPEKLYGKASAVGARHFKARPISVMSSSGPVFLAENSWARDLWTKVGQTRFMRQKTLSQDGFGEGGRVVVSGKVILANSSLRKNKTIASLKERGFNVYFVSSGFVFEPRISLVLGEKTLIKHGHPDLFVGVVGKVMLVDRAFFIQNKSVLNRACRENGLKRVFISEADAAVFPANFLEIGENTVLVDRDAKLTIEALREAGVNVVPTETSLRNNRLIGGGVKCIVNEI